MTTFEWMDPQTTRILFPWAPVGAKKLGVRSESRSAVGVSFSTSNTLEEAWGSPPRSRRTLTRKGFKSE